MCYEFLCRGQNDEQVLVYINSETGMEEQILILIETDNGTLAIKRKKESAKADSFLYCLILKNRKLNMYKNNECK